MWIVPSWVWGGDLRGGEKLEVEGNGSKRQAIVRI